MVRSAPDGYTIGMGTLGQYVISGAVYPLQFDMLADLTPVALLPNVPYWMVARKGLPANNLKELVDMAQGQSGQGVGHVGRQRRAWRGSAAWDFRRRPAPSFQFVPYRGGAPALNDLVAGQVDLSCDLAANSLSQYRSGNIKAYAVMTKARWFAAPEVPTAEEAGVPGLYYSTWHGLWAPKGTPAGHRRQDQRRRQRRDGRSGGAKAHRRRSAWTCRRTIKRRRRRSRRSTSPKSRSGIRS